MLKLIEKYDNVKTKLATENGKDYREKDYSKIKQLRLEEKIITNNIIATFVKDDYENVINVLKKYQGKKIGEKTMEKIANEIKGLKDYFQYVYMSRGYDEWTKNNYSLSIEIKCNYSRYDNVKIKIAFDYFEKYFEENGGYRIDLNYYKVDNYKLIDDIDKAILDINSRFTELKEERERVIKEFNDKLEDFYTTFNNGMIFTEDFKIKNL